MSNPYFDRSPAFKEGGTAVVERTPHGYPTMPGYEPGRVGQTATSGQQAARYGQVSPQQVAGLEQQYAAPSAVNVDRAPPRCSASSSRSAP